MTHYLPLNRFTLMLGHFTNGQALPSYFSQDQELVKP